MGLKQSKTSNVEPDPQSGDEWKTWYNLHLSISEIEKFKHRLNHIGHSLDENQSLKVHLYRESYHFWPKI